MSAIISSSAVRRMPTVDRAARRQSLIWLLADLLNDDVAHERNSQIAVEILEALPPNLAGGVELWLETAIDQIAEVAR